jgi:hypothetical protein
MTNVISNNVGSRIIDSTVKAGWDYITDQDANTGGSITADALSRAGIMALMVGVAGSGAAAFNANISANVISNTAEAIIDKTSIGSNVFADGSISLTANDLSTVDALSVGVAGSGGGAGGAMLAGNVIANKVKTLINGSTVDADGNITLDSESSSVIRTLAVGVAAAGGGAVQLSVMGNVVSNEVASEITGDSTVTAAGDISLSASDTAPDSNPIQPPMGLSDATDDLFSYIEIDIEANILALMVSVAGSGGFSANAVAMANVISNDVGARISGSTVKAGVDDAGLVTLTDGDIMLEAISKARIMALEVGVAGTGGVALNLNIASNTISNTVESTIVDIGVGSGRTIEAGGSITLKAEDSSVVDALSVGVAGSGAAAGGAMIAANVIGNTVKTMISGSTVKAGANVDLDTDSASLIRTIAVGVAASGGGAGQFSGMGNVIANTVEAEINASDVTAGGYLALSASEDAPSALTGLPLPNGMMSDVNTILNDADLDWSMNVLALMVSVGGSGGFAANAAMMGNVVKNKVRSRIVGSNAVAGSGDFYTFDENGDPVMIPNTGVHVEALTDSKIMALLVGVAGSGGVSVNANITGNVIANDVESVVDSSDLDVEGNVDLTAKDSSTIDGISIGVAASGGGAGGAAIAANVITNNVRTAINNGSSAIIDGSLSLSAESSSIVRTIAVGVSGSGGVSAQFTVMGNAVANTVESVIDNSTISTGGDVTLSALDIAPSSIPAYFIPGSWSDDLSDALSGSPIDLTSNILALNVSVAGSGAVSINGAFTGNVIANRVNTDIRGSTVRAGVGADGTPVNALADIDLNTVSSAGIISATVGVSASAGFALDAVGFGNVITNTVSATIVDSPTVDAGGYIALSAKDWSTIRSLGLSVAASGTGAVSIIAGANVITNMVAAQIAGSGLSSGSNSYDVLDKNGDIEETLTGVGIRVDAQSDADIMAFAGGVAVSVVTGVQTAAVSNVIANTVDASIGDYETTRDLLGTDDYGVPTLGLPAKQYTGASSVDSHGSVILNAGDSSTIDALGFGVAGSGGGGAVGVAVASNVITNNVNSSISGGSTVTAGMDGSDNVDNDLANVTLDATSAAIIRTLAIGVSVSSDVAVQMTVLGNAVSNNVAAEISGSTVLAGGDVSLSASDEAPSMVPFVEAIDDYVPDSDADPNAPPEDDDSLTTKQRLNKALTDSPISLTSNILSLNVSVAGSGAVAVNGAFTGNVIANSVKTAISGSTVKAGRNADNSIANGTADISLDSQSKAGITSATVGVGASGGVAIDAVGYGNVITNEVSSKITGAATTVASGGLVSMLAQDKSTIRSLGLSIAASGGVAVSIIAGANVITNTIQAQIDGSTVVAGTNDFEIYDDAGILVETIAGVGVRLEALSNADIMAFAGGVAASGATAVQMSATVNTIINTISATIENNAYVDADGSVQLIANDSSTIDSLGFGVAASGVGGAVGIAVASNVITNNVNSSISGGSTVTAGVDGSNNVDNNLANVTLDAISAAIIRTLALGVSATSDVAVQVTVLGNSVSNNVIAEISGSTVLAGGDVSLSASDKAPSSVPPWLVPADRSAELNSALVDSPIDLDTNILSLNVSIAGSGAVAINGAFTGNVIANSVRTGISDSTVKAGRNADNSIANGTADVSLDSQSKAGIISATVGVGASGGVAIDAVGYGNVITNEVSSKITGAVTTVASGGLTSLLAQDKSTIRSVGLSIAASGGVAVSIIAGANVITNTIQTQIDDATVVAGINDFEVYDDAGILVETIAGVGVRLEALSNADIMAFAGGVAASGATAVQMSATVNTIINTISATIENNADVDAVGSVLLIANDSSKIDSLGFGVAASGMGGAAGMAIAGNAVGNTITTAISNSNVDAGGDVSLDSSSSSIIRMLALGVSASGDFAAQFTVVGNLVTNTVTADIGSSTVNAGGDVILTATDKAPDMFDLDWLVGDKQSDIDTATQDSSIDLNANILAMVINFAGSGGVAAGVTVMGNEIKNTVQSQISGSTVDAIGNMTMLSESKSRIIAVTAGMAVSALASVDAQIVGNQIDNNVSAKIIGGSTVVEADGGVSLTAKDDSDITAIGLSFAASGGIAGSVLYVENKIGNTIEAIIDGATVRSGLDIALNAQSNASIMAFVGGVAVSGGASGVLSLTTNTIGNTTIASIENGADVDAGVMGASTGSVNVKAKDSSIINSLALGLSAGAVYGAGAAIANNNIGYEEIRDANGDVIGYAPRANSVTARIVDSNVNADGGVIVQADASAIIRSLAAGIAGGGLAGGQASVTLNKIGNQVTALISGSTVTADGNVEVRASDLAPSALNLFDAMPLAADDKSSLQDSTKDSSFNPNANIVSFAGSLAVAGGVAGSAAVSDNKISNTIKASIIDSNVTTTGILGDVIVSTTSDARILSLAAGIGAAAGGAASASLSLNSINNTIESGISGSSLISAGNNVNVTADDASAIEAFSISLSGAIGAAIGGAFVNNTVANDTVAYINGTSAADVRVLKAGQINVAAHSVPDINAMSLGATIGAVAAGATEALSWVGGSTRAYVGQYSEIGMTDVVGSLDISAVSDARVTSKVIAVSAGIGAGSVNWAKAHIDPTVRAYIDNASVTVDGTVSVLAESNVLANADAKGVNAGALAVGVSTSEVIIGDSIVDTPSNRLLNPDVSARVGGNISAGGLSITASQASLNGEESKANATGSAGALIGVDSTSSKSQNNTSVVSSVADGSILYISGATIISAESDTEQVADASSSSGGLVAVGFAKATTTSDTILNAGLGNGVVLNDGSGGSAVSLSINAIGRDDNYATTTAGSGGVIAGAASSTKTNSVSDTSVNIGSASNIDVGQLSMTAQHSAVFDGTTDSTTAAVVGASGSDVKNTTIADVDVNIANNVSATADDIDIVARNIISKNEGWINGPNVSAGSGGLTGGPAASSSTVIANNTLISVGDGAALVADGDPGNNDALRLTALNEVTALDRVKLDSGGAIALANAKSSIVNDVNTNKIEIGASDLSSSGNIELSTINDVVVDSQANAKTYGLAGAAEGESTARVNIDNDVLIKDGAVLTAQRDVALMAGLNSVGDVSQYLVSARTDLWNKTALPINLPPKADGTLNQDVDVTIADGAWVGSGRNVFLIAETGSGNEVVGKGVGKDLYRAALEGLSEALGGDLSLEIKGGNGGVQSGSADVVVAGTVEAGINNAAVILIAKDAGSLPASGITGLDSSLNIDTSSGIAIATTDGITYQVETGGSLLAAIDERIAGIEALKAQYAGTADAEAKFDAQLSILNALRADIDDTQVKFINIDPIVASSGDIIIRGDSITGAGTGSMTASTDTQVVIRNESDHYLRTSDIEIPQYAGGYIRFNYGELDTAEALTFNYLDSIDNNPSVPSIVIDSSGNIDSSGGSADPIPGIEITGDIKNLNGLVDIYTDGSIYIWASMDDLTESVSIVSDTINIYAGGDFVQSSIPVFDHIGGMPMGSWDGVTSISEALKDDFTVTDAGGSADVTGLPWYFAGYEPILESRIDNMVDTARGSLIAGNRVFIAAEHLNLNGYVQSGFKDKSVTLPEAGTLEGDILHNQIAEYDSDYHQRVSGGEINVNPLYLLDLGVNAENVGNVVFYDAKEDVIEIRDVSIQGGFIHLYGDIINTGSGTLNVLDGFGRINIDNRSDYDLVVNNLNAGNEVEGEIRIIDTAKGTTTIYTKDASGNVVVTVDDGATITTTSHADPSTVVYDPLAGQCYSWVTGQEQREVEVRYDHDKSLNLWLFTIDALVADSVNWSKHNFSLDPLPLLEGEYYRSSSPVTDLIYGYDYEKLTLKDLALVDDKTIIPEYGQTDLEYIDDNLTSIDLKDVNPYQEDKTYWEWQDHGFHLWNPFGKDPWIPVWVYVPVHESYAEIVYAKTTKDIHTHTIAADNAINIQFSGYTSGGIDISSSSDITLRGTIKNDSGNTTIVANGAVDRDRAADSAVIEAADLVIYAGTGIGQENTILTRLNGGTVSAYTLSGDISIHEIAGALTVKEIEIPHFDPFVGPGEDFEFNPDNAVEGSTYTIDLGVAHGLSTGDVVTYSSGLGAAIGGLTSGTDYKVLVVNSTTLMLADTGKDLSSAESALKNNGIGAVENLVIHVDATSSTGAQHSLMVDDGVRDTVTADFGTAGGASADIIDFGFAHGLLDGQAVTYSTGGAVIPGLVDGATYYVSVVDASRIRLSDERDNIISYLPTVIPLDPSSATGFDHSFTPVGGGTEVSINRFEVTPFSILDASLVYDTGDFIYFNFEHGLKTGTEITYAEGNNVIGGLVDGTKYYVIALNDQIIRLASTEANALNNNYINLDNPVLDIDFGVQPKIIVEKSNVKNTFDFDPITTIGGDSSTLDFGAAHNLTQDQAVVYHDSGEGDPITGLTSGTTYYVDVVDSETIRLLDGIGGNVIVIGVPANLSGSYYLDPVLGTSLNDPTLLVVEFDPKVTTAGSDQLMLGAGHGFEVGDKVQYLNDTSNVPVTGLTVGETYLVVDTLPDGKTVQLNDVNNTLLDLGTGHGFTVGDAFTYEGIAGINTGVTYYVVDAGSDYVKLAETEGGTLIQFDARGINYTIGHKLSRISINDSKFNPFSGLADLDLSDNMVTFDPASQTSGTAINVTHNYYDGLEVVYQSGPNDSVGGLGSSTDFVVSKLADNTIQLSHEAGGPAIDFTFASEDAIHLLNDAGTDVDVVLSDQTKYIVFDAVHGLVGDANNEIDVTYDNGGNASVGNLTSGTTYTAYILDDRTVALKSGTGEPIEFNFNVAGTHTLGGVDFTPSAQNSYLVLAQYGPNPNQQPLTEVPDDGDVVTYDRNGWTVIGGLEDVYDYNVISVAENTVSLKHGTGGVAIALDFASASGTNHNLTQGTVNLAIDTAVQGTDVTDISFSTAHGVNTGDWLTCNTDIYTGLSAGTDYYVTKVDDTTIRLSIDDTSPAISSNYQDAIAGTYYFSYPSSVTHQFDLTTQDTYLVFDAAHGYATGQAVTYNNAGAGSDIGGLTDSSTYYVTVIDTKTVTLSATSTGPAIALGFDTAGLSGHSLNDGSTDKSFDPTTQDDYIILASAHGLATDDVVTYSPGSASAINGLTSGSSYFVRYVDASTIELESTVGSGAISLDFNAAEGSGHSLASKDIIHADHQFEDGQEVVFHTMDSLGNFDGSAGIFAGLTAGASYYVNVIDSTTISLALSQGDLASGIYVPLNVDPSKLDQDLQYKFSSKDTLIFSEPHNLVVGEEVRYVSGSATSVDGLIDGNSYFIVAMTSDEVSGNYSVTLSDTKGGSPIAVDIVSELKLVVGNDDDHLTTDYHLVSLNKLDMGVEHGYEEGDQVIYHTTGTDIGLVDGDTYTVNKVNDTTIRLIDSGSNLVQLNIDAFNNSSHDFRFVNNLIDLALINTTQETISLGVAHELNTGDMVSYHTDSVSIGGLTDGAIYYVDVVDPETLRLALSRDDLASGTFVELDASGVSSTGHRLAVIESRGLNTVDDLVADNIIDVGYAHGFATGQEVIYNNGTGSDIGGLTDGSTYYVVVVSPTAFKLAANLSDILISNPDVVTLGTLTAGVHDFAPVEVLTGAAGDVTLTAEGSIVAFDSNSIIQGGLIALTSNDAIGTAGQALQINTSTSSSDGLIGLANGDIYIEEMSGDLNVIDVESRTGNVDITASSGALRDSNVAEEADELAIEDLMSMWDDMNLTGAAAAAAAQETIDAYVALREREYNSYWDLRDQQADPTQYDPSFVVVLGAEERAAYEDHYTEVGLEQGLSGAALDQFVADAIAALEEKRNDEYHELHTVYGVLGDVALRKHEYHRYWDLRNQQADPTQYDPSFVVVLSAEERAVYEDYYRGVGLEQGLSGAALDQFVADEITAIESDRTAEYHALHTVYGAFGDTETADWSYPAASVYEPSFAASGAVDDLNNTINVGTHLFRTGEGVLYDNGGGVSIGGLENGVIYYVVVVDSSTIQLALTEKDALAATPDIIIDITATGSGTHSFSVIEAIRDGSVWTDAQLKYSIGGGWLKNATDTTTRIEDANVTAGNITLNGEAIGADMEEVVIDLTSGITSLTDDQKVALAATERTSMVIIDGPKDSITLGTPHELATGDAVDLPGVWKLNNVNGLSGLIAGTYYAIVTDPFTFQLATTQIDAMNGVSIDITTHEVRLQSKEDLDVSASGVLDATVTDFAYIGSEEDLAINAIQAGGAVCVKVGGIITDGSDISEPVNITAGDLTIEAAGGSIGEDIDRFDVTLSGSFSGRADDALYLNSVAADLYVDTIYTNNSVTISSDGSILDAYDTDYENIDTVDLFLYSSASIGSAANNLELNQRPGGPLFADSTGDIYLAEVAGDMNVNLVQSSTGDVFLLADVSILDFNNDIQANVSSGRSITLQTQLGSIGDVGNDFEIDTDTVADAISGTLTVDSNLSAYLVEFAGDLTIFQTASTLGTIYIASPGQMLNGNSSGTNVLSGWTRLYAGSNIGAAGNPLNTTVGFLEGTSVGGQVWIENTGHLTVGGVSSGLYGIEAGGDVVIVATSPITVTESIKGATITKIATDDNTDGTVDTDDDLIVVSGVTLEATGGVINLFAGDDLVIQNGATVQATTIVNLRADYGNMDTSGSIIDLQGVVTGTAVSIQTGTDDDSIVLSRVDSDTDIQTMHGDDAIYLGSNATVTDYATGTVTNSGGTLNTVLADVSVDGGLHVTGDSLFLDNSGVTGGTSATFTADTITGFGMAPGVILTYREIENLGVDFGVGNDEINIQGSSSTLSIDAGAGNDTFNVSSDGPVNSTSGTLDGILGDLNLDGGDGSNVLNINDHGDPSDDPAVTIIRDSISGLAPATINYTTSGNGNFGGGINVWTGSGSETITIGSTRAGDITTLWLNDGNDSVTAIDDGSGADGLLVIAGEGGNDTVNASAWSTDMILFGDYGEVEYAGSTIPVYGGSIPFKSKNNGTVSISTSAPDSGGSDSLAGGSGNDYIFGGAHNDSAYGRAGNDVLIGDGGMITLNSGQLHIVETIDHFIGGDDFLDGGSGNNILLGGYGSDTFVGDLSSNLMFGEYARIMFEDQQVKSVVRLAQGVHDLIGSNQFDLYGSPFGANAFEEDEVSYFGTEVSIEELSEKRRGYSYSYPSSASMPSIDEIEKIREKQIEEVEAAKTTSESKFIDEIDTEVVKGGNLWNLAKEYYGDPFLWEKIWKANPEIIDPDLIDIGQEIKIPKDIPEWMMKGKEAPEEDSEENTEADEETPLPEEETGDVNEKDEGREIDNSHEMEKRIEDDDSDEMEVEEEDAEADGDTLLHQEETGDGEALLNEADLGLVAVGMAGWRAVASSGVKGEGRLTMNDAFNDMGEKMAISRRMRWKDGKVTLLRGESKKKRNGFKII